MTDTPPANETVSTIQLARPPRFSVAFTARDLLNVAIFAVIYFVIIFAVAMLGIISPLVTLLTLPLSAIAAATAHDPRILFWTNRVPTSPPTRRTGSPRPLPTSKQTG